MRELKLGERMKKQIKAVFFDIDSTIYMHSIHDLPQSTKIALMKLQEEGIKVGIATSRCRYELSNMPKFFREYPFAAWISDGGALVMEADQILSAQYLPKEQVQTILAYAQKTKQSLRYSTVSGDYFAFPPHQVDKDIFFKLYLNTPLLKPYENDEVLNLLLYVQNEREIDAVTALLPGISIVNHGSVLEVNHGQIDKSDGVKVLAKHWQIDMEEILCFGDGANDVNFLKEAGIGVAMGNGCQAVKDVADYICAPIDQDGVYHALHHFGCIKG